MAAREGIVYPFGGRRLLLDVGVGCLDGEDGLAALDLLVELVTVDQLDAESLSQAMANLGSGHGRVRCCLGRLISRSSLGSWRRELRQGARSPLSLSAYRATEQGSFILYGEDVCRRSDGNRGVG